MVGETSDLREETPPLGSNSLMARLVSRPSLRLLVPGAGGLRTSYGLEFSSMLEKGFKPRKELGGRKVTMVEERGRWKDRETTLWRKTA